MKPQDFTRFTPDNEEKWLYKDITEKIIGAANDEAQLLNYLKATRKRVGLLLNVGEESLEIRKKIL